MRRQDDGNVYKVSLVESSSPLTKRPSTPFRLSALGLMEEEVCRKSTETVSEPLESKPNGNPIVSGINRRECELEIDTEEVSGTVGDSFTIKVEHGSNGIIFEGYEVMSADGVNVKQVKDGVTVTSSKPFNGDINIAAKYGDCMTCEFSIYAEFKEKPKPEPDGEDDNEVIEEIIGSCGINIQPFNLKVGDVATMNRFDDIEEEFHITDSSIASMEIQSDKVLVTALQPGRTVLTITNRYADGRVCNNTAEIVVAG